jgi:hypothetical protein
MSQKQQHHHFWFLGFVWVTRVFLSPGQFETDYKDRLNPKVAVCFPWFSTESDDIALEKY